MKARKIKMGVSAKYARKKKQDGEKKSDKEETREGGSFSPTVIMVR